MTNYFLPTINNYFKEIAWLEGKIYVIDSMAKIFLKHIENNHYPEGRLNESGLYYRDLSTNDNEINLFSSQYNYKMNIANYQNEVENISSGIFCLKIDQAYECFETFLKDILTDFFLNNRTHPITIKLMKTSLYLSRDFIRGQLLREKKDNKKLIATLRNISPFFKVNEINNTWKINISDWFQILSEVRHNIIHNRQIISNRLVQFLISNNTETIFSNFFNRKEINGHMSIFMTHELMGKNIEMINNYAHLIFKSLSIDNNLDPKYYKM